MAIRLTQLLSKHSQFREYFFLVCTKTVDSVSRALWLATQSVNVLNYSLIHLQFRERFQTRVSCEQNAFPVAAVTNKQTSQLIKEAVPEIHEEIKVTKFDQFGRFNR